MLVNVLHKLLRAAIPSRDAVSAGAAAVFRHNWCLAVQSGRSALVGGHSRNSVGWFRHCWRNVATVTSPPEIHIKAGCKGSPMTRRVLIDYQTRGWAKRNEPTIQKEYSDIRYVGTEPNPAADAPDWEIASFCVGNGYDLLTKDQKAYTYLLDVQNVEAVRISKYAMDRSHAVPIYLVKIL